MRKLGYIFQENLDLLVFTILITIKICFYTTLTGTSFLYCIYILPPILASILILISLTILCKRHNRAKVLLIADVIISIIIVADINYFRYFKDIVSISIIRNITLLGSVKSSVGSIFKITDLLFFIDLLFLIPLKYIYKKINFRELSLRIKITCFSIMLLLGALINTFYFYNLSIEQPRLITTMFNRIYIAEKLGIINAHGIDIYNYLSSAVKNSRPVSATKQQEIMTFMESNSTPSSSNYSGIAKGKNLIMIQVEALQQFVINRSVNGNEITPNLNKWLKNSLYFDNFYYQVAAGGTSDAEFMTNNSLYPASSGAVYYLYANNEYNSIAKSFKDQGYETSALHGYRESFWNRNIMYKALGFDNFYSEKDYNINENVGLGLSDASFLNQSIEKLQNMKKPYYSFMITLSSHYPFDDIKHYGDFNVGDLENTLTGNYLKAIHYTDEQLGTFLNKLDKTGISKDSIIVLYGDHYAIPKDNKAELAKLLNINQMNDLQWMELQKVPMLIHFPGNSNSGVNHVSAGQMDIYPTLSNLFSLNTNDLLGKDLLNPKSGNVIFRNGSFTDGKVFYLSQTDTYYDISTGNKISPTSDLKKEKEASINQLEYSDTILQHNLLKIYNNEKK